MYRQRIAASDDLNDQLPVLTTHLHDFTGSTGVYVGHLERPKQSIDEDADDRAHIDEEAIPEIKWIEASPSTHGFLKGEAVKETEGVVHQLWGIK